MIDLIATGDHRMREEYLVECIYTQRSHYSWHSINLGNKTLVAINREHPWSDDVVYVIDKDYAVVPV